MLHLKVMNILIINNFTTNQTCIKIVSIIITNLKNIIIVMNIIIILISIIIIMTIIIIPIIILKIFWLGLTIIIGKKFYNYFIKKFILEFISFKFLDFFITIS